MRKTLNLIIGLILFMPFLNINALSCYENVIDVEKVSNFPCSEINGETLTFKDEKTKEDLSSFFQYDSNNSNISIIDKSIKFDTSIEVGKIIISDGTSETTIKIKNHAYIKPTTTTTTTTTKDANSRTLTVTLDPNNGTETTIKTCDVKSDNTTCAVTLPKIDNENFNGWGTAKSCKEGNSGTIKVEKDITYYACYKNNENESNSNIDDPNSKELLLKTLTLKDKKTEEKIDFGTFSIKNKEYSFKVLNEIENIVVNAEAEEGINVEISGNENLSVGENKIIIKLTDNNNNQSEYILNVTRLDEGETLSTVKYLRSLVVGGYQINFNKDVFVYNLTIPNDINKLEITAVPENEEDDYVVKNSENLTDGSQIIVEVVSKDGQTTPYTINITKESNINYIVIGAIGLIVILIIILIILIIMKSKKKKKSINSKNNQSDKIEVLNI